MRRRDSKSGLSLIEVLIALSLTCFLGLSIYTLTLKAKVNATSLTSRNRNIIEMESLFQNLRKNVNNSTRFESTSYGKVLRLNVWDSVANKYTSVVYRIRNVSGVDNFEMSVDGGTTWRSPYNIALSTTYKVTGEFIYCGYNNNCTRFNDTNANGVYDPGVDAAGTLVAGYSGTPLTDPSKANKILLSGFSFDRGLGNPPIKKVWPNTFLKLKPLRVWKTNMLVQSFSTISGNFNAAFRVRDIEWDARDRRMLLAGYGNDLIYPTTRDGIKINGTVQPVPGGQFDGITFENYDGGKILHLLDKTAGQYYRWDLKTNTLASSFATGGFVTNPSAITWDSGSPNDVYIIGISHGIPHVLKRNKATGAASAGTNEWHLPAGLTNPAGMTIDPATGAFYIVQNAVSGAGATRTIDIYRIDRASPTTADIIQVNIADLGSVATSATTNYFGLAYEVETNRLFISDLASNMVYEVIPNRMLTLHQ